MGAGTKKTSKNQPTVRHDQVSRDGSSHICMLQACLNSYLVSLVVNLHPVSLAVVIDPLEGVAAITVHEAVAIRSATRREQHHHLVDKNWCTSESPDPHKYPKCTPSSPKTTYRTTPPTIPVQEFKEVCSPVYIKVHPLAILRNTQQRSCKKTHGTLCLGQPQNLLWIAKLTICATTPEDTTYTARGLCAPDAQTRAPETGSPRTCQGPSSASQGSSSGCG